MLFRENPNDMPWVRESKMVGYRSAGCQGGVSAKGGVHLRKEVLVMPVVGKKFFPWVFGGVVLAIVVLDVALFCSCIPIRENW
jgi:hypothetical protein